MRFHKLSCLLLVVSAITACTPLSRVEFMENFAKDTRSLHEEYTDETYSEPMQLVYALWGADPHNKQYHNNLDAFNIYKYTDPNAVQNALQVGTVISTSNPLQMLSRVGLIELNKSAPSRSLSSNQLILMMPYSGNVDADANYLHDLKIDMIANAYAEAGTPVAVEHSPTGNLNGLGRWNPRYLLPKGLSYCKNKNVDDFNDIMFRRKQVCGTLVLNAGDLYLNNTDVSMAPKGDWLVSITQLPDNFPVEKLDTNKDYSYLYIPPVIYSASGVYSKLSGEEIVKLHEQGRIKLNPVMKNLKTGQIYYFNKELQKLQLSPNEFIDEKAAFVANK